MTPEQTLVFAYLGLRKAGIQKSMFGDYLLSTDMQNNDADYCFPVNATTIDILEHTNSKRRQFGILTAKTFLKGFDNAYKKQ
jgi:hypothetical protein